LYRGKEVVEKTSICRTPERIYEQTERKKEVVNRVSIDLERPDIPARTRRRTRRGSSRAAVRPSVSLLILLGSIAVSLLLLRGRFPGSRRRKSMAR
jgi:hypothetical protein